MKTLFLVMLISISFVSCGSINSKIAKWDVENYQANKDLSIATMKTWSLNSGFIAGLGLTSEIKFPIVSSGQLRAIINNPALVMALVDLDEVVRRRGYWSDEDYDYGFFLGAKVRAGSQAIIQFIKDYFPNLMQYAPTLFAL